MTVRAKARRPTRPERLDNAPLDHAPESELGVVFLFAHLAKKWRLRVDQISPSFPDCIAYQKTDGGEKRVRIEFELKSRNFREHGHDARGCDWIVCWEHNWPGCPSRLRVIELRREFGLGFNVWVQAVAGRFSEKISSTARKKWHWSVPSRATDGDLVLYYHTRPDMCIRDIFQLVGHVEHITAGYKPGKDYMGHIRRVCQLKAPVFLEDMQQDRILRTAAFVRATMQGRPNATEYWPYLYAMILRRNPSVRASLAKFAPDKVGWAPR